MATDTDKLVGESKNDGGSAGENLKMTTENELTKPDLNEDPSKLAPTDGGSAAEGMRKDCEVSKTSLSTLGSGAGNDATVSNIQKKIRRAERFGMSVQLSEEEKRNSRAERFGTRSTLHGSEALKKSEELKRKARAERFGISVPPAPADEEVKKKARLARFGGDTKTESMEEDKRKARAIRFSKPISNSSSQVSGSENIQQKAAKAV